jgi:hypothetical protein
LWLIACKAKSNSSELDKDFTQCCIWEEHSFSSSLITTSYHDLIGFVEEIVDASSFVGF